MTCRLAPATVQVTAQRGPGATTPGPVTLTPRTSLPWDKPPPRSWPRCPRLHALSLGLCLPRTTLVWTWKQVLLVSPQAAEEARLGVSPCVSPLLLAVLLEHGLSRALAQDC